MCQESIKTDDRVAPAIGLSLPSTESIGGFNSVVEVLARIADDLRRIADHVDPSPPDIVDTPYLARQLGVTPTRIAQLVRNGEIPKSCIVAGSGNGRPWKFHRRRIEEWLAKR